MIQTDFIAERKLWDVYHKGYLSKGWDIRLSLREWINEQKQLLASPGARQDFKELVEAGCAEIVLAGILLAMRSTPKLQRLWSDHGGSPDKRQQFREKLQGACDALESVIGTEDSLHEDEFAAIGRISPGRLVLELRLLSELSVLPELLAGSLRVYSLQELCRFVLVGYVRRATGNWRDRNCSALIGVAESAPEYGEVNQRMWRNRNFKVRITDGLETFSSFLFAMGKAIDLGT
jgi:hypothetical protein